MEANELSLTELRLLSLQRSISALLVWFLEWKVGNLSSANAELAMPL